MCVEGEGRAHVERKHNYQELVVSVTETITFSSYSLHFAPAAYFPSSLYGLIAVASSHMGSGLLAENVISLLKPNLMFPTVQQHCQMRGSREK